MAIIARGISHFNGGALWDEGLMAVDDVYTLLYLQPDMKPLFSSLDIAHTGRTVSRGAKFGDSSRFLFLWREREIF